MPRSRLSAGWVAAGYSRAISPVITAIVASGVLSSWAAPAASVATATTRSSRSAVSRSRAR